MNIYEPPPDMYAFFDRYPGGRERFQQFKDDMDELRWERARQSNLAHAQSQQLVGAVNPPFIEPHGQPFRQQQPVTVAQTTRPQAGQAVPQVPPQQQRILANTGLTPGGQAHTSTQVTPQVNQLAQPIQPVQVQESPQSTRETSAQLSQSQSIPTQGDQEQAAAKQGPLEMLWLDYPEEDE